MDYSYGYEAYLLQARQVHDTVKGYHDSSGWTVVKSSRNITISGKPSPCLEHEGHLYRGEVELNCCPKTAWKYLDPLGGQGSLRLRWEKELKEVNVLKNIAENLVLQQSITNTMALGMVSSRELIYLVLREETDDGFLACGLSVDDPNYPPQAKYVRAWTFPWANMVFAVPGKPDCARIVNYMHMDFKGNLPKNLIDKAMPTSMVASFDKLQDVLRKDGQLKK